MELRALSFHDLRATSMTIYPKYSHDGISDPLTHCAAPPLLYSHLDRMISGSKRTGAPLTLALISISIRSSTEEILAMAHVINQMMRKEDLCGRTGHFQFVIVLSGSLSNGEKLLERIQNATNIEFRSELVQWVPEETSLQLLYRLDLAAEFKV
jgi:GGDEF domain-containing protein